MSQYSFPILDNDELLPCMEEMEVSLTAANLAKPTYEVLRPIFEQLVIMLTGVTREELMQPVFTAMDAFEYPELHDESVPINNFFRQLSKLLTASGVKDFSWQDVVKPDPQRLRRHLSAIINFAKFREEKALAFQELQAQLVALIENSKALEEQYHSDSGELKRWQQQLAEQMAEVAQVEAEDQEILQHNTQLSKLSNVLQGEIRALKQETNQLVDQASQAKFDLSALKLETEQLKDQIVQSPDKHRQAIAEMAAAVQSKRTYFATLNSASLDQDRRLEMFVKLHKEVDRCIKLLEELDGAVTKKKAVSQQVKDVQESIRSTDRALAELTNTNMALKRHQATLQENHQRLEMQASLKMEAAASSVEEQLKCKEAVEADIAAVAARAAEDEAVIRCVQERMQEMQSQYDSQVAAVMDKYHLLRKAVGDYNRRLEAAMACH